MYLITDDMYYWVSGYGNEKYWCWLSENFEEAVCCIRSDFEGARKRPDLKEKGFIPLPFFY